ncbi:hypothetical protein [Neorhizobium galegae]|uniref:hypothetical protein n=1 Tax=Neorhizobium galegae TaxID=399 RepID=UPI000B26E299|nr:hypothetical protein [Neorhizobium galegae]
MLRFILLPEDCAAAASGTALAAATVAADEISKFLREISSWVGFCIASSSSTNGREALRPAAQSEALKAQFDPANTEIAIRKLIFLARNNADEQAKRRLMPIVRDLIQTGVIGKTPGHQPASLQVHGDIANIMASMDVIDIMQQQQQLSLPPRTI